MIIITECIFLEQATTTTKKLVDVDVVDDDVDDDDVVDDDIVDIDVDRFCIALFSTLEQTHCTRV